jgi:hypothetical protein
MQSSVFGEIAGWFLFLLTFFLPLFYIEFRKDRSLIIAVWISLVVHQIIAILNAYVFLNIFYSCGDAFVFHKLAVKLTINEGYLFTNLFTNVDGKFYTNFLGSVYQIFGTSYFLAHQITLLSHVFSIVVLVKLLRLTGFYSYRIGIVLAFAMLPTNIIWGSVPLRETHQILFFMLFIYFIIKYHVVNQKRWMLYALISAFLLTRFHHGLALFVVVAVLIMSISRIWKPAKKILLTISKKRLYLIGAIVVGMTLALTFLNLGGATYELLSGNILKYATKYRGGHNISRAYYGVDFEIHSITAFLTSGSRIFLYYMLAPFPWQISSFIDIYAVFENTWRFFLIIFSVRHYLKSQGPNKRMIRMLIILYVLMALIWAAGTVNYGTALRHHMVNYWIIVILGVPGFTSFMRSKFLIPITGVSSKNSSSLNIKLHQ